MPRENSGDHLVIGRDARHDRQMDGQVKQRRIEGEKKERKIVEEGGSMAVARERKRGIIKLNGMDNREYKVVLVVNHDHEQWKKTRWMGQLLLLS